MGSTEARVLKTSFTSGEWSPSMYARVDISQFADSAKRIENALPHAHGGVSNRTGTRHVGIQPASAGNKKIRLINFQFSVVQTYVLEFSDYKMRVIKDGGFVLVGSTSNIYELTTPFSAEDLEGLNYTQSADVLFISHKNYPPKTITRLDHDNWVIGDVSFSADVTVPSAPSLSTSLTSGSKNLEYKIAAVNDKGEESTPSPKASTSWDGEWAQEDYVKLTFNGQTDAESFNVYKSQNGFFGFIGRVVTEGSTSSFTFTDDNILPKTDDGPQASKNPFDSAGNYPDAVDIYHLRMIIGRTNDQTKTVWLSQTGRLSNFNISHPLKPDDSIEATMASNQVNEIKYFKAIEELLIFTTGGVWKLTGKGDSALSATSLDFKIQEHYGCADVPPIAIGSVILYLQRGGRVVRELAYSLEQDSYDSGDASILATHLFKNREVVNWALQTTPENIVWCVMSDGKLISLTYNNRQKVKAWARHTTDGYFEDVAAITGSDGDEVYFVVKRKTATGWERHIEMLTPAVEDDTDIEACTFLDDSLQLDNPVDIEDIYVNGSNEVCIKSTGHGFSATTKIDIREVDGEGWESFNTYLFDAEVIDVDNLKLKNRLNGNSVEPPADVSNLVGYGVYRQAYLSISGLDHLEGRVISVLANGNVLENLTVTGGSVTLGTTASQYASRINAGIPYRTIIETLPIEIGGATDTLQGKIQKISEVTLRLDNTRGLAVGPNEDHAREIKSRSFEGYNEPTAPFSGYKVINITPTWRKQGDIYIEQKYPLPMNILSVIPSVEAGDK